MRKGQMEFIGLVFVVLLIILGLLFVVVFDISEEKSTPQKDYLYKQVTSNMVNSIIHTTAQDCNKNTIEDLMRDCVTGETVTCNNGGSPEASCDYVQGALETMFDETLDKWFYNGYTFNVSTAGIPPTHLFLTDDLPDIECTKDKPGQNALFPIPLNNGGHLYINLYICR